MKKGKEYELLVEQIYKELQSDAEIKQDDFIQGEESGIKRQIDLSIRYRIVDIEMLIVVQAKDWGRKADVKVVDEFKSVIKDVRAQKGILICNAGFTKAAINYAKKERIELYSAHTALNKKWHLAIELPAIKNEDIYELHFELMLPVIPLEQITMNPFYDLKKDGKVITKNEILNQVFQNVPLDKSGKIITINVNCDGIYCNQLNGDFRKVEEFDVKYKYLKSETKLNTFNPTEYRALKDYIQDKIIHSYVDLKSMLPALIDMGSWTKKGVNEFNYNIPHIEVKSISFQDYAKFMFKFNKP